MSSEAFGLYFYYLFGFAIHYNMAYPLIVNVPRLSDSIIAKLHS